MISYFFRFFRCWLVIFFSFHFWGPLAIVGGIKACSCLSSHLCYQLLSQFLMDLLKPCLLFADILKMYMWSFMETKLYLTELRFFKLSHFGKLLHYRVWSLRFQILSQFSVDFLQTLHTFCRHNADVNIEFWWRFDNFDRNTAFKLIHFWQLFILSGMGLCNQLLPQFVMNRFQTMHTFSTKWNCASEVLMEIKLIMIELCHLKLNHFRQLLY